MASRWPFARFGSERDGAISDKVDQIPPPTRRSCLFRSNSEDCRVVVARSASWHDGLEATFRVSSLLPLHPSILFARSNSEDNGGEREGANSDRVDQIPPPDPSIVSCQTEFELGRSFRWHDGLEATFWVSSILLPLQAEFGGQWRV